VLPDARWAEFRAGNAARRGWVGEGEEVEVVCVRWEELAAGKRGGCDCEDDGLNEGIGFEGVAVLEALGVVGEVGVLIEGSRGGGGGGGIAFRSCSTLEVCMVV